MVEGFWRLTEKVKRWVNVQFSVRADLFHSFSSSLLDVGRKEKKGREGKGKGKGKGVL